MESIGIGIDLGPVRGIGIGICLAKLVLYVSGLQCFLKRKNETEAVEDFLLTDRTIYEKVITDLQILVAINCY